MKDAVLLFKEELDPVNEISQTRSSSNVLDCIFQGLSKVSKLVVNFFGVNSSTRQRLQGNTSCSPVIRTTPHFYLIDGPKCSVLIQYLTDFFSDKSFKN